MKQNENEKWWKFWKSPSQIALIALTATYTAFIFRLKTRHRRKPPTTIENITTSQDDGYVRRKEGAGVLTPTLPPWRSLGGKQPIFRARFLNNFVHVMCSSDVWTSRATWSVTAAMQTGWRAHCVYLCKGLFWKYIIIVIHHDGRYKNNQASSFVINSAPLSRNEKEQNN